MNTQPEALRLADLLEKAYHMNLAGPDLEAAEELRRIYEVNQMLLEALEELSLYVAYNEDRWVKEKALAAIAKATGEQK